MISIKKKLIAMSLGISLGVVIAVSMVSFVLINKQNKLLSNLISEKSADFLAYLETSSKEAQETLAKESMSNLIAKARSLAEKDSMPLGIALGENSISFVREYISHAVSNDSDVVLGAFYAVSEDEVRIWQLSTKEIPKGAPLNASFDKRTSSWIFGKQSFPDPYLKDILQSRGQSLREIEIDGIKAVDVSLEVISADTGARAFLRYILTTDHILKSIAKEKEKLSQQLKQQNQIESESISMMSETSSNVKTASYFAIMAVSFLAFSVAYFISSYVASMLVVPIKKLQEIANRIASGQYNLNVDVMSRDEIGELAINFDQMRIKVRDFTNNLQGLVDERTRELSVSLNKTKAILNTIEQGIVTISGTPSKIDPEMSPYITTIFKKEQDQIKDMLFSELVIKPSKLDQDSQSTIMEALSACIGSNEFTWEANRDKLPRDMQIVIEGDTRFIQIDWCPMYNEDGSEVERVLVATKDLTDIKRREQKLQEEIKAKEEDVAKIAAIVSNSKESLLLFVSDVGKRIKSIQDEIHDLKSSKDAANSIYHHLHTIKGQARSLHLGDLANETHLAEDLLKNDGIGLPLFSQIEKLVFAYDGYVDVISKKLGWPIGESAFDFSTLIHKELVSFKNALINSGIHVSRVSLSDGIIKWRPECIANIQAVISHTVSNSIDHGYLLPLSNGVKKDGWIAISTSLNSNMVNIRIEDGGSGFNLNAIREKAASLGLDLAVFDNELDVILSPEFSTSKAVTQRTGRGVGMSAVKSIVDSYHGYIHLSNNASGGAVVSIDIPAIKLIDISNEDKYGIAS